MVRLDGVDALSLRGRVGVSVKSRFFWPEDPHPVILLTRKGAHTPVLAPYGVSIRSRNLPDE